jgi:hypothetical protein
MAGTTAGSISNKVSAAVQMTADAKTGIWARDLIGTATTTLGVTNSRLEWFGHAQLVAGGRVDERPAFGMS